MEVTKEQRPSGGSTQSQPRQHPSGCRAPELGGQGIPTLATRKRVPGFRIGLPGGACLKKRHISPTHVPPKIREGGESCGAGVEAGYGKGSGATGVAAGSVGVDASQAKPREESVAPCRGCRHEVRRASYTAVRSVKCACTMIDPRFYLQGVALLTRCLVMLLTQHEKCRASPV